MTPLVLACLVLAALVLMVGYLAVALVGVSVRALLRLPSPFPAPPAPVRAEEAPRWTALDDQQVARYLDQSPP